MECVLGEQGVLWIEGAEMAKLFWSQKGDVERIFTLTHVHRCKKLKTSLSLRFHILKNRFKFTPLHRVTKYQRNARMHHHADHAVRY